MRILLFDAPYTYNEANSMVGKYFPLGIGYLASYVRAKGYEPYIFQPPSDSKFGDALIDTIKKIRPNVVGVSVMTNTYPAAVYLLEIIKKEYDCITIMGGHHVSAIGEKVLRESSSIDYIVIGEGEETLFELLEALHNNRNVKNISGLGWRKEDGTPVINIQRSFIKDIDTLPFPARDLVDMSRYRSHSYIDYGKKTATMITSRGCPFKCIFCSSWLTMGTKYRFRSAESVLEEVQELVAHHGVDHIVFEDDTMTLKRDRMIEICRGFQSMREAPSWYCLSRVDSMDDELAQEMKRSGCRMISFGIESGDPVILEKIGKKINIEKAVQAVAACTKVGIRTLCTFIVGFPFDTKKSMEATLNAARKIKPTMAIFFPLTPYPGTVIFNKFMNPEMIPRTVAQWSDYIVTSGGGLVSTNPGFKGEEIRDIATEWNWRFYSRPSQVLRIMRTVSSPKELYRVLLGGMYVIRQKIKSLLTHFQLL